MCYFSPRKQAWSSRNFSSDGVPLCWQKHNIAPHFEKEDNMNETRGIHYANLWHCHWDSGIGCVHAYFAKAESAFWNTDSKRRSKTPLIQAIVRAQVNRKGVYMTSFKRGYNVILRSLLPPESAFCSNHDRKRTSLGCVHAYFAKAFWNADSKRRSKTPVHGSTVHASLEKKTIRLLEEGMSRNSRNV